MSRTSLFVTAFAFAGSLGFVATASAGMRDEVAPVRGVRTASVAPLPEVGLIDLDLDLGLDLELGHCFDIDVALGAVCGVVADVDANIACNPLSVEAACYAELGKDCGLEEFIACTAELTAQCKAELAAGGALFCDGVFVGADICLGGLLDLNLGIDLDVDACLDVDLDADLDLDGLLGLIDIGLGICLDVTLDANVSCDIAVGDLCIDLVVPDAVEQPCLDILGENCSNHEFAACQTELLKNMESDCDLGGAAICDADIYVGADICLGIDLGIDIGL